VDSLTFVCWKWRSAAGYRSTFSAQTVNVLAGMLKRHYHGPHELVCVTDDPKDIDPAIRIVPLWSDHGELPSPHGRGYPSCYRRLRMFSAEAEQWFGPRFVSMDLDVVITGDITPLFANNLDIKLYGDVAHRTPYNGSLIQLRAGSRRQVWDTFDPIESPKQTLKAGMVGSDQAWIAAALGPGEAKWGQLDGVHSFRNHIARAGYQLPANARIVIMHGNVDPWSPQANMISWIRKWYRA
jgi:hypothetical protein